MSTSPRVSSAIPGQAPHFGSVMAQSPLLLRRFGDLYATFWSKGVADHRSKEVARMRNARVTDCGF
ncbi:MAG: hypothetical protein ACKVT1_17825 [Dehalococcoidia bacterium]